MARIVAASSHEELALRGWELAAPERPLGDPARLAAAGLAWLPAEVPGTAAAALRRAGCPVDPADGAALDRREWWWRCRFPGEPGPPGSRVLRLDGLATRCDAWLNGAPLLRSESMFAAHALDVGERLASENELLLRFAPLEEALPTRRPRPRFRTAFARTQHLRLLRTALLGRIPGWPAPPPIGPWRPIVLERRGPVAVLAASVATALEGADGVARVALSVLPVGGAAPPRRAVLRVGAAAAELTVTPEAGGDRGILIEGTVRLPGVARWWPATHGEPALHAAAVELEGAAPVQVDLGRVGFRTVEADRAGGGFRLHVNGVPVFCRGAVWVPPDAESLAAPPERVRAALTAVRDAGMNMVRVGGTFVYEPPLFHALCDELGILVWQDLMFAALDYPGDDPAFAAAATAEAAQVAGALQASPSLAVLCGGTETLHQQALLCGPGEPSRGRLFEDALRAACGAARPDVPYVANSPGDGPGAAWEVDGGIAHYYGVGPYRRPIEDARRSDVRFAAEALGFGNVPEPAATEAWLEGAAPVASPRWKRGVPHGAGAGAGWDFDDVRDHYLEARFGEPAAPLRAEDPQRYLALSRVVSGEVMEETLAELRAGGRCGGALVWTLSDLVPGAGWGLLDASGAPKAAYWLLRRALQPIAVLLTDEGMNGLRLHLVNDGPAPFEGTAEVVLLRGEVTVAEGRRQVTVPAHGVARLPVRAVLGRFADENRAFRFGPPQHDVVAARLLDAGGALRSEAVHLPGGRRRILAQDPGLRAAAHRAGAGRFVLHLEARRLAYAAAVRAEGAAWPMESHVHVTPGRTREIVIRTAPGAPLRGEVEPLNGPPVRFAAPGEDTP
jgi:beta-mannosidase